MSLQLDARQRAMLREMGIELFWPQAAPVDARTLLAEAPASPVPAPAAAPPRRIEMPPAAPATTPVARAQPPAAEAALRPPAGGVDRMEWEALEQAVRACRACGLCEGRRNTVFGAGDRQADWLVIGEAPGEHEDQHGEPFLGDHGRLLDNMLASLGVSRARGAYIANVLKCSPPANRNPQPEEIAQCEPFLRRQVDLLRPKIILLMGRFAVQALLRTTEPVGRLRGRVHRYHGVPVVVTYHPAYLLRNLPDKAKAWADLCLAQSVIRQAASA